ncbi:hypothetical protein [Pseudoduganella sp. OTU4001]|uniref:hypothetical protein n=1 Tax=Pseudoduganella sp. OTU4001 TaxID=3043854 RepID=UPI00313EC3C6
MRYAVFMAATVALMPAVAAAAGVRAPTLAEQRSFQQFWQRIAPGMPAPALRMERAPGASVLAATASVDAPPLRLVLPLCRVERTRYTQQANDSWRTDSSQHVWVHHTTSCGTPPATMVELRAALPEIEILKLLQAKGEMLQRARLLMAGNTSCAPMRARNFSAAALDRGADGLPLLVYRSDIGGELRLSVRPARTDFVPWNVACSP